MSRDLLLLVICPPALIACGSPGEAGSCDLSPDSPLCQPSADTTSDSALPDTSSADAPPADSIPTDGTQIDTALPDTVDPDACAGRLDISGDYLLAVATVMNPSAPLLFFADFAIDTSAEPWGLTVTMQPISHGDRSDVGTAFEATGTIAGDGVFSLDFGEVTIPGAANPVIPGVDVVAALLMGGCTNSLTFNCGNIAGSITTPAQLPLTGSTYGAVALNDDLATADIVSACPVVE